MVLKVKSEKKVCYICHREEDDVRELAEKTMLDAPVILFNVINLGKENVHLCIVCQTIFEKTFNDVLGPFVKPVFERVLNRPLSQFLAFVQSFTQAGELVVAEFGLAVRPQSDPSPPAKMDFEVTDANVKTLVRNAVRGLNHIFSHLGMVLKRLPQASPKDTEFPGGVPDPEDV